MNIHIVVQTASLPFALARCLCKYVVLAIDVGNSVLQHVLPLILDALHLVIQTQHDHSIFEILVIRKCIFLLLAVVQIAVDVFVARVIVHTAVRLLQPPQDMRRHLQLYL